MFRDLLSSRLIQVGLAFFVLVIGGSLIYSWHDKRTIEKVLAPHDRFLQGLKKKKNGTRLVKAENRNETAARVETPREQAENIAQETESLEFTSDSVSVEAMDPFAPDAVSTAETPAEEVPVSPFGFGPYPEVPADYPLQDPIWIRNPNFEAGPDHAQRPFELMDRVLIKLWEQGHTNITGASMSMKDGKVYPHYANTAYIQYEEITTPDGVVHRFVTKIKGGPDIAPFYKQIRDNNTPAHIQLIDYDSAGIDPYTFLNEKENKK